ncbi:MAG: MBL fold metallo-hydrolase [Proteobacteria bacterium]|nr:MBL fold metallo-hydrolase [Pseudomonadota bacterium]
MSALTAKVLGCGGSNGVPEIGCQCYTCRSNNSKNKRLRASLLLSTKTTNVLIDTTPDLRTQALENGVHKVDAVLYTHAHSDHINGIDDLKLLSKPRPIKAYADEYTLKELTNKFNYIFNGSTGGLYTPLLEGVKVTPYTPFSVGDMRIIPLLQHHHDISSLSFRVGDIAYSTDFSSLPEQTIELLQGVRYWFVDCLRYGWAPTHQYLEKVMRYVYKVKPEKAFLVHMNHQIEYEEMLKLLPHGWVMPAYDGLVVSA